MFVEDLACSAGVFLASERQVLLREMCGSPLSWILKAEEGWGEIEISTKGVVDRREEGGGRGGEKKNTHPLPTHFYRTQT